MSWKLQRKKRYSLELKSRSQEEKEEEEKLILSTLHYIEEIWRRMNFKWLLPWSLRSIIEFEKHRARAHGVWKALWLTDRAKADPFRSSPSLEISFTDMAKAISIGSSPSSEVY